MRTITADQAEEILEASYGDPGDEAGDFTYVTTTAAAPRRWAQGITIVVSDSEGEFWGLSYDRGLTEEQPNEYPWRDGGSCELTRMYPHTITKTVYRTKPQEVNAR
jgi:hypothetical protein